MSLLFFIRPTELLNIEQKRMDSLTDALQAAAGAKKVIGNSVTINLEAAAPSNKLQIAPLLNKSGGYNPISVQNSTMLPAAFVLRLNQGMPVTTLLVEEIKRITNNLGVVGAEIKSEQSDVNAASSLVNLIVQHESQGTYTNGQKGLFVSLSDQSHCYFICDNSELTGTVIKSIQFTEAAHVTKIIKLLRQQALFNALIGSCVRQQNNRQDFDSFMFEVNVVSLQFIQVFVEHPIKESIVTVELDLTDVKKVGCKINGSDQQYDAKLENYILKVLQKTMSIPMILRSLIKYWDHESQESQHTQKRLFNNGIYGSIADPKKDGDGKNDDKEKSDTNGSNEDSYGGNGQSGAFDICGINKNEIFFKTSEPKRFETSDIFDRKMSRVMSFDLNDENDEMMMPERCSPSPANSISSDSRKGFSKVGTPSMDVFEFNDPSPPPATTVMVPMQSPLAEERAKKIPTPRASPSMTTTPFSMDKRVHDIEMVPLKNVPEATAAISPANYEKPKSEKKKKRKREDGDMGSPAMVKKKSSDSLGSPSKKSQLMGKPSASFSVPKKSPAASDAMDDLSFLNFGVEQQVRSQFI